MLDKNDLKYSQDYTVTFSYIDNRGITRPSAIADFMQDAATVHEMNLSIMKGEGFWVLSKLKYNLKRPLFPYETVTVATWCGDVKGAIWYRNFSFHVNDELIGTGITAWVVLDRETHKIIRPTSIPNYESYLPNEKTAEKLGKIEKYNITSSEIHIVKYSDIDVNNHLNNVKAVDIIGNAIGLHNYEKEFISEIQVNYLAESYSDEELVINISKRDRNEMCIYAEYGGKSRFEAEMKLSRWKE